MDDEEDTLNEELWFDWPTPALLIGEMMTRYSPSPSVPVKATLVRLVHRLRARSRSVLTNSSPVSESHIYFGRMLCVIAARGRHRDVVIAWVSAGDSRLEPSTE